MAHTATSVFSVAIEPINLLMHGMETWLEIYIYPSSPPLYKHTLRSDLTTIPSSMSCLAIIPVSAEEARRVPSAFVL